MHINKTSLKQILQIHAMWMFIGLLVLFLALLEYYRIIKWDMRANLPGPKPYPIVGNSFHYINHTPETLIEQVKKEFKKYKGMYRVTILGQFYVAVYDSKDIEPIVNSSRHMTKNEIYDSIRPWLKEGLLLSQGAKWFKRRKVITPAFHFSMLEQFVQIFDEQSSILVEKLKPHAADGEVFDINNYIALAALDAVSESALGIQINAQTNKECEYVRAIHEISPIVTERFIKHHQKIDILFGICSYATKKRHDKLLKVLHSFTQNIIEKRRQALQKEVNTPNFDEDYEIGKKKRLAFLDLLLQTTIDGKPLSNDDIREEVDTFTFEGHDTTTSGICFTLFLISRHPEVQKKMFEEIREVFGDDKTRPASYKDLQQLKYTELVIKEGLRMYPPVPVIGRVLDEDLRIGDKFLAAGTSVILLLLLAMKNPEYFPDPDKFIPERHSAETSGATLNPFAYIPFSAGPRNCIGQKFAMLEMKSMITKILRHYELLPLGRDLRPIVSIVLRSLTGYEMGLKPRLY